MNEWVKKSFELTNGNYLDRLHDVYPILSDSERQIGNIDEIKKAYDEKNNEKLFLLLLSLEKFPIKDSYKSFFTNTSPNKRIEVINNNPQTVKRICERLYTIGWSNVLAGIEEPKEPNRRIGPLFRNWFTNQYKSSSYTDFKTFIDSTDKISILDGKDNKLNDFVSNALGLNLPSLKGNNPKGLDLVVKINTIPKPTYIIGESKFLSDTGGNQNNQYLTSFAFLTDKNLKNNNSNFNIIKILVFDGICWIKNKKTRICKGIEALDDEQIVISSLLLDEFFNSFLE